MKTEILPYQRIGSVHGNSEQVKEKSIFREMFSKNAAILLPMAFLLGRASLIGGLMPFGMAIFASTLKIKFNRPLLAIFILLGMLSRGAAEQIYVTSAAMFLFTIFNLPFKKKDSKLNFRIAMISFISVIIPEFVTVYLQGFLLFDMLKAMFHGFVVFSLVFIFGNITGVMESTKKTYVFSNEEMISIAILSALTLSGLTDMEVMGFNIRNVLCILLVLIFSFKCGPGVGSAVGVTVGLIVNMASTSTPILIGSYAFCGLLSGILRNLGKVGSGLGFVMGNAILTLYLNGSIEVLIYLKEIALAVGIFILIPRKLIEAIAGRFDRNVDTCVDKRSYSQRIKEMTIEKLNKFSRAFKELSKTFSEISETKVVTDKQDISVMFDRVADKVCKDCSLCLHCWDRNFYDTYQVMFKIVERLDGKGRIEQNDIPEYFMSRCERIQDFVEAVNNIYELFKVDMVWKSKIGESRGLVSQQLEGLSRVISNLASEIDMDIHFKGDMEETIILELNKAGIRANEAMVFENKWGKYEINVFHKGCGGKRSCITVIEKLVSEIVGRKMVKEDNDCQQHIKGKACSLKLVEEEAFRVTTGIAKASKQNGAVSGDSYTFMNTGDGKFIVALSDGMGSGQRAATQSRATVSMLEQFMESGFDKDTTVKLINSILVLKSNDDSFATIDLSVIDLHDGNVEFVKVGAIPTYIKKEDRIDVVKSASLPAGILSNIETELVNKKVDSGDFIIMLSDGILDSFKKDEEGEKALRDFIHEVKSKNPQEIADRILDEAYSNYEKKPVDDMMVIVAKVWKRAA